MVDDVAIYFEKNLASFGFAVFFFGVRLLSGRRLGSDHHWDHRGVVASCVFVSLHLDGRDVVRNQMDMKKHKSNCYAFIRLCVFLFLFKHGYPMRTMV